MKKRPSVTSSKSSFGTEAERKKNLVQGPDVDVEFSDPSEHNESSESSESGSRPHLLHLKASPHRTQI